jgi:hypothetical protein
MTYVIGYCVQKAASEERKMQKTEPYTIDLTKIHGKGKVSCPKCGVEISPDDTSEEVYTILEPVVRGNCLEKIVLQCNSCRSQISLVGFGALNKAAKKRN